MSVQYIFPEQPGVCVVEKKHMVQTKHQRKTSEHQKEKLIEYFEKHPDAQQVVSANNTDSELKKKIWTEVANTLNVMTGGVQKTPLKWGKTWADMKLYTKNRAKGAMAGTLSVLARRPTDLDRRMLKIIGQTELLADWEQTINDDNKKISVNQHVQEHDYEYEYLYEDAEEGLGEEYEDRNSQDIKPIVHIVDDYQYLSDGEAVEIIDTAQNKRKIRMQRETLEPESNQESKRFCKDETQNNSSSKDETRNTAIASALNNLADAMNNVASALLSISDVVKTISR